MQELTHLIWGKYIECPVGTMGSQWDAQGENLIACGQRNYTERPECSALTRKVKGALVQSNDMKKGNRFSGSGSYDMKWERTWETRMCI